MRTFTHCALILVSVILIQSKTKAESFTKVDDQFLWLTANLSGTKVSGSRTVATASDERKVLLHGLAYERYFEQHGCAPPLDFLQAFKKGSSSVASISGKNVFFYQSGRYIPLRTDVAPIGAEQATPYLLEVPRAGIVLVVYPYYAYGCKDNDHYVEIFSGDGKRLQTFDSLPTHFLIDNPNLFVSHEKSGCCDSLKWHIRFYNIDTGKVLDLGCPEGFCGDVLFTRLGKAGPFFVGQEIIGAVEGLGASLQSNIYIIDSDGTLSASGKIIHAISDPAIQKQHMQEISPFAIAKLYSARAVESTHSWQFVFQDQHGPMMLELTGVFKGDTPTIVFLMPKNSDQASVVEIDGQELDLPILGISKPGEITVSLKVSKDSQKINVLADRVNKIIF